MVVALGVVLDATVMVVVVVVLVVAAAAVVLLYSMCFKTDIQI